MQDIPEPPPQPAAVGYRPWFAVALLLLVVASGAVIWRLVISRGPTLAPVATVPTAPGGQVTGLQGDATSLLLDPSPSTDAGGGTTPTVTGVTAGSAAGAAGPAAGPAAGAIAVDVVGAVRRPGVVWLPPGARVADAVAAAGGLLRPRARSGVNLAKPLGDGEQVVVGATGLGAGAGGGPGATPQSAGIGASGSASDAGGRTGGTANRARLNLNTATATELEELPGVGPVLAAAILAWRQEHGRFGSVAQLDEVSGVGEATLARLTPLLVAQ